MQDILHLLTLIIFVFCSLVVFAYQGRANEIKDIYRVASQAPALLKSYQFSFELRGGSSDPRKYEKVDVWQSGSNIKSISTWIFPEGEEMDPLLEPFEYAFNGTDYQWFSTGLTALTFSKKCRHPTPYWTPSPLMWPYYWLVEQQSNWSDVKDMSNWEARFKEAKYLGTKIENGIHLEVVSFPFPQMNLDRVFVYFAKDQNYYPIEMRGFKEGMNGGLPVLQMQVTRFKIFDIDGMSFVFPLNVEARFGTDESVQGNLIHWTVDESSIKINPQLDEDLFTISPSRATSVTDYDEMLATGLWAPSDDVADDGRDIVHEPLPKRTWDSQRIFVFVVLNLIVVALLTYLLLRRRK